MIKSLGKKKNPKYSVTGQWPVRMLRLWDDWEGGSQCVVSKGDYNADLLSMDIGELIESSQISLLLDLLLKVQKYLLHKGYDIN